MKPPHSAGDPAKIEPIIFYFCFGVIGGAAGLIFLALWVGLVSFFDLG